MKIPGIEKIANIILLTLLLTASVAQNGKLLGINNDKWFKADSPEATVEAPSADQLGRAGFQNASTKQLQKGIWEITVAGQATGKVIATLEYNRKTFGFAGPIPMYLFLDHNDEIKNVTILNNSEDKEFIDSAIQKGVLSQWAGLSVLDAVTLKPDAVSGATMSSRAINTSIERSLSALTGNPAMQNQMIHLDTKDAVALLVLAFGVFASFFNKKLPKLRPTLLVLNCLFLGFWCGKFISFTTLLGYAENGISLRTNLIGLLLLMLAVIMPLVFRKKAYYCTWVCPFGAAQELAGKVMKNRTIPSGWMTVLKQSRKCITIGLFAAMWLGVSTGIAGYEPFAAFLFQHASAAVLVIAGLSLVLALFTPRPWCRFACPTGEMLKWMDKLS